MITNGEILTSPKPTAFDRDVVQLAGLSHDAWRSSREVGRDGLYAPRRKSTGDEAWIAGHGGDATFDLANTDFQDLPPDWQEENAASAKVALEHAYRTAFYGADNYGERRFLYFPAFTNDAGRGVHIEWLERNAEHAAAGQNLPFDRLSEEGRKTKTALFTHVPPTSLTGTWPMVVFLSPTI